MAEIVGFKLNLKLLKNYDEFVDQFPFIISHAMNTTAKGPGVEYMRAGLGKTHDGIGAGFTVRNNYTRGGIRFYKAATKSDFIVRLGAVNDYLRAQTIGTSDNDRPDGGRDIGAVPLGPTRSPADKTTARRNEWPMQLIVRGLAYRRGIDHTRKRRAQEGPTLPGRRLRKVKDRPDPLEPGQVLFGTKKGGNQDKSLWYIASDRDTEVKPAYPAAELVHSAFDHHFSGQLRKSVLYAIKTSPKRR